MSLSEHLRSIAQPLLEEQFSHPFVTGLADGSLPAELFKYYLIQDTLYIVDYARAMAWLAPLMPSTQDMMSMLEATRESLMIETLLKEQYFDRFGISQDEVKHSEMAPTCKAYVAYLFRHTRSGDLTAGLCALLPCNWIYIEIGQKFTERKAIPESNPYKSWLQTYTDPAFVTLVEWWFDLLDRQTKTSNQRAKEKLETIFITSSRFEHRFWEMCWQREKW